MQIKTPGFTLLEIIVAMVLIATISLFSIPFYREPHLKKLHQSAKMSLLLIAHELENYYELHHTYQGATLEQMALVPNKEYRFLISSSSELHYTIAAIPNKPTHDDLCGTFYIDQDGKKTISGQGSINDCW